MVGEGTQGSAGDRKPRIGARAAAGLWPPQKSAGIRARGLSFAELGTRGTRWRLRCWRVFGPRLGPLKGSRRRGGGVPLQETGGQRAWPAGDFKAHAGALPAAGWSLVQAGAPGSQRLHHQPQPPPRFSGKLGARGYQQAE